jgi:hypothetical protein
VQEGFRRRHGFTTRRQQREDRTGPEKAHRVSRAKRRSCSSIPDLEFLSKRMADLKDFWDKEFKAT